jgi:hypothetical protein
MKRGDSGVLAGRNPGWSGVLRGHELLAFLNVLASDRPGHFHSTTPMDRRSPTRGDVPFASELPDESFLSSFRTALLEHPHYSKFKPPNDQGASIQKPSNESSEGLFTYPLSLLSTYPVLPSNSEIERYATAFATILPNYAFVHNLPVPDITSSAAPPYLLLTFASLGSLLSTVTPLTDVLPDLDRPDSTAISESLLDASTRLANFMTEVDNRLIRTVSTYPLAQCSYCLQLYESITSSCPY